MTEPGLERSLKELLTMDAPDGAPHDLRDRVRDDLARASVGRVKTLWTAVAAALVVLIGAIAVIGPRIGLLAPTASPGDGLATHPVGSGASGSPLETIVPTMPVIPDTIEHPGLLVTGELLDRDHGFAETDKGQLLLTSSGGARWRNGDPPGLPSTSSVVVSFLDPMHAWLADMGKKEGSGLVLWRTTDGAASWTRATIDGVSTTLVDLGFLDAGTGWLGTDPGGEKPKPELRWTTDGGLTWSTPIDLAAALGAPTFPSGLEFLDVKRGFAANEHGLYRTDDGGRSWTLVDLPTPAAFLSNLFPSVPHVFAENHLVLGAAARFHDTPVGSLIYASDDGGATWRIVEQLSETDQRRFSFVDALDWVASDGHQVTWTDDGGTTWDAAPVSGLPQPFQRFTLLMSDTEVGIGLVVSGSPCVDFGCPFSISELFKTVDGGRTWARLGDCDPKGDYRFACLRG